MAFRPSPPTSLPPSGAAGGDLTGNYPNPTVANVSILTTKGDMLIETSNGVAGRLAIATATGQTLQKSAAGLPSWSADGYYDQQFAGFWAPFTGPYGTGAAALTASRAYITRFVAWKTVTITQMSFVVTTGAGANDNCDVGIFNSTFATLLGSSGSTAGKLNVTNNTVQTVALTAGVPVTAGTIYYAAFAVGTFGGSAASLACTSSAASSLAGMFGVTAPNVTTGFASAAFPLAAPFALSSTTGTCPILALQQ